MALNLDRSKVPSEVDLSVSRQVADDVLDEVDVGVERRVQVGTDVRRSALFPLVSEPCGEHGVSDDQEHVDGSTRFPELWEESELVLSRTVHRHTAPLGSVSERWKCTEIL